MSVYLPLYAKEAENSVTIFTEQMAPYNYLNSQKQVIGINVDITKELFKRANIAYSFELAPWKRSYKNALNTKNSAIISTAYTEKRANLFKWVGPISSSKGYLYKLASRRDIQLTQLKDSANYTVAVIRGGVYHRTFLELGLIENKNLLLFSNSNEYIAPFLQGKIDLILGSDIVMPHLLNTHNAQHNEVVEAIKMPDFKGNYIAMHPSFSDDEIARLNTLLVQMKRDGSFDKIVTYYNKKPRQRSFFN